MSLWGLCHSGQQVNGGHVTMGAMSQWAAGQCAQVTEGLCHSGEQVSGGHVTMGAM